MPMLLFIFLDLFKLEMCDRGSEMFNRGFFAITVGRKPLQILQGRDHLLHQGRDMFGAVGVDKVFEFFAWERELFFNVMVFRGKPKYFTTPTLN